MYSKQEASFLTERFWTSFGRYLAPVLSAEGEKINWINYKTGVKDIRFIMKADNKCVKISVALSHKNIVLQKLYFDKWIQFKKILHQILKEEWQWLPGANDHQIIAVSEIYCLLSNVNIFNQSDWPKIISFFKPRIIALDKFWCEYKFAFEPSDF